jgi:hypothetical protein
MPSRGDNVYVMDSKWNDSEDWEGVKWPTSGHYGYMLNYSSDPVYKRRRAAFEKTIRADEAEPLDEKFQAGLCDRCRSVRWSALAVTVIPVFSHKILESGMPSYKQCYDTTSDSREINVQLRMPPYVLCRYFASFFEGYSSSCDWSLSARSWPFGGNQGDGQILHAPLLSFYSSSRCVEDSLGILPLSGEEGELVPHAISSYLLNYTILREWLAFCQTSHSTTCHPSGTVGLPGFKVIDCSTRNVVQAPYVTLWYKFRVSCFAT